LKAQQNNEQINTNREKKMIQAIYTPKLRYAVVIATAAFLMNATNSLFAMGVVSANCQNQKKCNGADIKVRSQDLLDAQAGLVETLTIYRPDIIDSKRQAAFNRQKDRAQGRLNRTDEDDFKQFTKKRKQKANPDTTDTDNPLIDDFDDEYGGELVDAVDDVVGAINELNEELASSSSSALSASSLSATTSGVLGGFPPVAPALSAKARSKAAAITVAHVSQVAYDLAVLGCDQTAAGFNSSVACIAGAIVNAAIQLANDLIINGFNDDTARTVTATYNGAKETHRLVDGNKNALSVLLAKAIRVEAAVAPVPMPGEPEPPTIMDIENLVLANKDKLAELAYQQDRIEAQQQQIINLLQTPQGQRANFNK
jgi:hypothetical protein